MGIGNTQKLAPAPASPRLLSLLETSSQEHTAAHPVLESVAGGTLFATPRQHYVVARTLARSGQSLMEVLAILPGGWHIQRGRAYARLGVRKSRW